MVAVLTATISIWSLVTSHQDRQPLDFLVESSVLLGLNHDSDDLGLLGFVDLVCGAETSRDIGELNHGSTRAESIDGRYVDGTECFFESVLDVILRLQCKRHDRLLGYGSRIMSL